MNRCSLIVDRFNVILQYDYVYDVAGRRINVSKSGTAFNYDDTITYGYNEKSELTNAVAAVDSDYRYAYDFDDIGNRESSSERGTNSLYTANNLNQYTSISNSLSTFQPSTFQPVYDDDGNQTLVKTATGIWQVQYNGENRPILWTCTQSNNSNNTNNQTISMSYDRMGRRVTKNAQRFVYDGYLQIADKKGNKYIWNPTETMASSPLVWGDSFSAVYYDSDANKNISEVVSDNGNVVAHYEYAPFATVSVHHGALSATNPWRFSSEFADDETAMIYYNYRHYAPMMGRWLSRDPIGERDASSLLLFVGNAPLSYCDRIGLAVIMCTNQKPGVVLKDGGLKKEAYPIPGGKDAKDKPIYAAGKVEPGKLSIDICCQCLAKSSGREYSLVVQVKSSYRIRIVKVGSEGNEHTKKAGYGKRTQAGYDRTLKHEKVHVKQISNTMHKIYKDLTTGIPEKFPRNECNAKSDLAESRMLNAKGDWDIMIMNGNAHSGKEWEEWKKTDGKTETDPELW